MDKCDRRLVIGVLVLACLLTAILSGRSGSRTCSPLLGEDGTIESACEPFVQP